VPAAATSKFTLGQLAEALDATLDGDPGTVVTGVASLETAGPDQISFVTDLRYREAARTSRAGAFLAPPGDLDLPAPSLRSPAPRQALVELLTLFYPAAPAAPGIHPSALVADGASVAPTASVGPFVVVEPGATIGARARLWPFTYVGPDVHVGDDSVLYPGVVLREGVRLGRRVIVHAGAVLGADGFGYVFDGSAHRKIPQVGGVVVEDDVEIGANTTIDRAMLGDTLIRRGTKIDNLVQIAHNSEIGEHSILAAQVGISGSVRLGRGVVLAGQVGIADHLRLGDGAVVYAQAGVAQDIAPGERRMGTPSRPASQMRRIYVALERLPDLVRQTRAMERRLAQLEARLGTPGTTRQAEVDEHDAT
jgi:UDP-3-O-[3-hydroxymyristoyl] glucosamine N-acyltransferase